MSPGSPATLGAAHQPSPAFARYAIAVLALAGVAVMLVAAPYRVFDLDRFLVPKELVLHAAALLLVGPLVFRLRMAELSGVDILLLAFLGLSVLSATFATNHWLAARSLAVTWSSLIVFWSMGEVARAGRSRAIIIAVSIAVFAAAAAALLQAYGVESPYFSTSRLPGGTLGNRNFVAHVAAIGAPLLIIVAIGARRRIGLSLAAAALAAITGMLVLARSRASWVALAACLIVLLPGVWHAARRWPAAGGRRRIGVAAAASLAAVVAALIIPNSLEWRSKSPYLDSVRSVVDYKEGSGKGRLIQYANTVRLAAHHPLLGVGPGNWPVRYPAAVPSTDPSLDESTGMTANPWPSSDWMALASERGLLATLSLMLAFLGLLIDAGLQIRDARSFDDHLHALALAGVLVATAVAGLFDAVLLLPAPALIAWPVFGLARRARARTVVSLSARERAGTIASVVFLCSAATVHSALQLRAIGDYNRGALDRAVREDPGNYRIRLRLAEQASGRGRCDLVRTHAGAAHALFPSAPAPRRLLAGCGDSAPR